MTKKYAIACVFIFFAYQSKAQQYGLFNTKTLFDVFENPAQKSFVLDSSRQFASNFFFPNFGLNAANKGDATYTVRRLIDEGIYTSSKLPLGSEKYNTAYQNANIYLLTFRIFKSYKFNKELGFAWQVRTDARVDYTNESLALLDNYQRFDPGVAYNDVFNDRGFAQSYHQFSINYRENYNKRLSLGIKLSLLSGITTNNLEVENSSLYIDPGTEQVLLGLKGTYKASFLNSGEVSKNTFFPNFKNPGISFSLGTSYTSKKGITLMANLKDLGFIKWNKQSHVVTFLSIPEIINKVSDGTLSSDPGQDVYDLIKDSDRQKSFYTLTNAKADFLISKPFNFYVPGLILSKNLFYKGGDIAFVNTLKYNEFSGSLTPTYNLNGFAMLGIQGMYKTPNFEVFIGSDNLTKSFALAKNVATSTGYNGASFYMGMGIKFGYVVNHPLNSSYIPGLENDSDQSFFKRMFNTLNIFKRK